MKEIWIFKGIIRKFEFPAPAGDEPGLTEGELPLQIQEEVEKIGEINKRSEIEGRNTRIGLSVAGPTINSDGKRIFIAHKVLYVLE